MSRHIENLHRPCASRQGSVFVLVISILAVLGLMTLVFSFSTRMELNASRNWADKVQANMAALTGVATDLPTQGASESVQTSAVSQQEKLAPVSLQITPKLSINRQFVRTTDEQKAYQDADRIAEQQYSVSNDFPGDPEALANFLVEDTSAKININAVQPGYDTHTNGAEAAPSPLTEQTLARLIEDVLTTARIGNIDPATLANAIVEYRYGPDGRPGEASVDDNGDSRMSGLSDNKYDAERDSLFGPDGQRIIRINRDRLDNDRDGVIDEADESIESDGLDNDNDGQIDESGEGVDNPADAPIDIRQTPFGDDRPYESLVELNKIKGMTPEAYQALAPHLTVFSASHAAYELPSAETTVNSDGTQAEFEGLAKVDPNTAEAKVLYETLIRRLPSTDQRVVGQFVANIIDRRDLDDIPSRVMLDGREYYGLEMNPCINEVCPDTSSLDEDGDDGQYLELFNPYSKDLFLDGWRIEGAGAPIRLTGSLPSGGYLVLTDDFNNENDDTPEWDPGQGSFFNIFDMIPTGGKKRLEEVPSLDLPNDEGMLKLINAENKLIDIFTWTNGTWTGAALSFQRIDPRLRASERVMATPLAPNNSFDEADQTAMRSLKIQEKGQNKPFRCALDVMLVSSAYAEGSALNNAQAQTENISQAWALPVLRSGNKLMLDLRLTDCFRTGVILPDLNRPTNLIQTTTDLDSDIITVTGQMPQVPCDTEFGLINLNTAAPAILAALPGMNSSLVSSIYVARMSWLNPDKDEVVFRSQSLNHENAQWWMSIHPNADPCWQNLSDYLLDDTIWQDRPLYDRLDTVYPFYNLLTTHSQSLRVVSANRLPVPETTDTGEETTVRPTYSRAERIISSDRGSVETVTFRFLDQDDLYRGDPDLRYAKADPSAEKTYEEELKLFDPYLHNVEPQVDSNLQISRY